MTRDHSDISAKLAIRKKVIEMMAGKPIKVLDLYAGQGLMKKMVWEEAAKEYLGLEKRFSRADCWRGDNMRLLESAMQEQEWNVFDLDAWGNPWIAATEVCRLVGPGCFGMALTCGISRSLRTDRAGKYVRQVTGLEDISETRLLRRWYDDIVRWIMADWEGLGVKVHTVHRARSRQAIDVVYWAMRLEKKAVGITMTCKQKPNVSGLDPKMLSKGDNMLEEMDILVGVKAICEYCGGVSPKTLKRWQQRRSFPVHVSGGAWIASKTKIREWTAQNVEGLRREVRGRG